MLCNSGGVGRQGIAYVTTFFSFGLGRVLLADHEGRDYHDLPVFIYRRLRLLRALGELPRSHDLTAATPPPDHAAAIGLARTGQYRGDVSRWFGMGTP